MMSPRCSRRVGGGVSNGALLSRIEDKFDAFVTVDANMPAQQALDGRPFAVVVLRAPSNRLEDLAPLVPDILAALGRLKPGELARLPTG